MNKSIIINPLFSPSDDIIKREFIQKIIADRSFDVIEIWDALDDDFYAILNEFKYRIVFDVNLSPLMQRLNINLCSTIQDESEKAIKYISQRLYILNSVGIKYISFSSPKCDKSINRDVLIQCYKNNLLKVLSITKKLNMITSFELFDTSIDKKRLLGSTSEIFNFFEDIRRYYEEFFLTWDLGHICLQGEDYKQSFIKLSCFIGRIHLSNYSLKKNKWYYGDKHLPFYKYGEFSHRDLKKIVKLIVNCNIFSLAFEVSKNDRIKGFRDFFGIYKYILFLNKKILKN